MSQKSPSTTPLQSPDEAKALRHEAKMLYWQGWHVSGIAEKLSLPRSTVQSWKKMDAWDKSVPLDRIEGGLEARMLQLVLKENKTGGDYKEIDLLGRQLERMARVRQYTQTGREADLNPNINARNEAPRKTKGTRKNELTQEHIDLLKASFDETILPYQREWFDAREHKTRMILKSRQIGATWYFAREAVIRALETGNNQIFLSASKAQALVFRAYIVDWVERATGLVLTGENLKVYFNHEGEDKSAEFIFLGTNFRTAQSYHGDLYIDEAFWINGFEKIYSVAGGMASHKQYHVTLISTPSAKSHEAYPHWTGEAINKGRLEGEKLKIDLSDAVIKAGALGEDRVWRQLVTIHDAESKGCTFFNIEDLKFRNSAERFANLYLCIFIDDSNSVFSFTELQRCMVDSDTQWDDFRRYYDRPFGNKPVWVGHDAGLMGDGSSLVVIAPPDVPGGKFRLLERLRLSANYQAQATALEDVLKRYNVEFMAIDVTGGYGWAVHELIKPSYPRVKAVQYSVDSKDRMVLKAQSILRKRRFEMDASETDLIRAFLSIRRTLTKNQKALTYETGRNEESGHGESAWAAMHCFINEPLDEQTVSAPKGMMEMF